MKFKFSVTEKIIYVDAKFIVTGKLNLIFMDMNNILINRN